MNSVPFLLFHLVPALLLLLLLLLVVVVAVVVVLPLCHWGTEAPVALQTAAQFPTHNIMYKGCSLPEMPVACT